MAKQSLSSSEVDSSIVYRSDAEICKVGNAIAFDVNDASLPGNAKNKHITIVFRQRPRFNELDLQSMKRLFADYKNSVNLSNNDNLSFQIKKWGQRSCLVTGQLYNAAMYLRQQFSAIANAKIDPQRQRPIHVELFVSKRTIAEHRSYRKRKSVAADTIDSNPLPLLSNNASIESEFSLDTVYQTKASICKVGNAIAFNVNDALLPGNTRNKHVTIVYRRQPTYSYQELQMMKTLLTTYKRQKKLGDKRISFSIQPWGKHSFYVTGQLQMIATHLRRKFCGIPSTHTDETEQRPLHVALFTHEKKGNKGRQMRRWSSAALIDVTREKKEDSNDDNDNDGDDASSTAAADFYDRIYTTKARLYRVGNAISIDVNDAALPGSAKGKHVNIIYRQHPTFNERDLQTMNGLMSEYKRNNNIGSNDSLSFQLKKWGQRSWLIIGQLRTVATELRQQFSEMPNANIIASKQRPIYVELRKTNDPPIIDTIAESKENDWFSTVVSVTNAKPTHKRRYSAPPKMYRKADRNIDSNRIYETQCNIVTVGRTIAFDLEDSGLPGNKTKRHATIFYRKKQHWSDGEIVMLSTKRDEWIHRRYNGNKQKIPFVLQPWANGSHSANINGDLFDLIWFLRNECKRLCSDDQCTPHVALWRS